MKLDAKFALSISAMTSEILLKNGAETYRIEDTINRMLSICEFEEIQCFVIPTGIFISVETRDDTFSIIRRVKRSTIDLQKIEEVNEFARNFSNRLIDPKEAKELLNQIDNTKKYSNVTQLIASGVSAGFFAVVFGGNLIDLIFGFFIGILIRLYLINSNKISLGFFMDSLFSSFIAGFLANTFNALNLGVNENALIIGAIMQLVPGVLITNSIRDSISGEIIAGLSKASEAIFIAIAIALGIIIPMFLFSRIGGII